MMNSVFLLALCVAFILSTSLAQKPTDLSYVYWRNATKRTAGSVLPQPDNINYYDTRKYLEINVKELKIVNLLKSKCITVDLALERYLKNYFFDDIGPEVKDDPHGGQHEKDGQLQTIWIMGGKNFTCELLPQPDMDEAYHVTVNFNGTSRAYEAILSSNSGWGLLRALETFSQLIFNIKLSDQHLGGTRDVFGINVVSIDDRPRFKHRGFMLDTARHYIPLSTIFKILDAMSFDKLNVFHWHIADDQSFPFVSKTYPQLSEKGAFRPKMVYTRADIELVTVYAAMRGIRVLPELDSPGHTYSLRHIPNLLSECYDEQTNKKNGDFGPVDPTKKSAYEAMDRLLTELGSAFIDRHFFAGGDEVDFDCWRSNPRINSWMEKQSMSNNYTELSNYYMRNLYKIVKKHEKTMIVWQEVFDMGANLPRDVIVSVWKDIKDRPAYMAKLASVVEQGYRALLSSCWYLNYIDYGQDWIKFYKCDPRSKPVKAENEHLVLGGEICMWTEFVDDTNVISRTWPRASAAAERLWSPKDANKVDEFLNRLEQHRCRLLYRGIEAEPVNGPGYC